VGKIATAGNNGTRVRSDCFIQIELTQAGGLEIDLKSKVKAMFGSEIKQQIKKIFAFFDVQNARVVVDDKGALPFVLAARIEAALKKLITTEKAYLPEMIKENKYSTASDKYRFSRLYLPGNSPSIMINAGLHEPDGVILDLEDSVAPDKKHEARFLIRNALRQVDFYGAERMVRINQIPEGLDDLDYIIPSNVNLVLVPKCEGAEQIHLVNERIEKIKQQNGINNPVWLMPIIESALGVIKAYEIAIAADNVVALAVGLEDYTADLGTRRTNEGTESFYARSAVVNAARAAKIQPIDSVFF
jgi:citrate lyase subunit beta / citryl-CoA lyase